MARKRSGDTTGWDHTGSPKSPLFVRRGGKVPDGAIHRRVGWSRQRQLQSSGPHFVGRQAHVAISAKSDEPSKPPYRNGAAAKSPKPRLPVNGAAPGGLMARLRAASGPAREPRAIANGDLASTPAHDRITPTPTPTPTPTRTPAAKTPAPAARTSQSNPPPGQPNDRKSGGMVSVDISLLQGLKSTTAKEQPAPAAPGADQSGLQAHDPSAGNPVSELETQQPSRTKAESQPDDTKTNNAEPVGDAQSATAEPLKPASSGQTAHEREALRPEVASGAGNGAGSGGGDGGSGHGGSGNGGGSGKDGDQNGGGDDGMDPSLLGLRRQRREDIEFREGIQKGLRQCRGSLAAVGVFSLVLNILILAIPIYLFQVSDRVLTSRSIDTLIMLTVVVVGALAIYAILDVVRRLILMRVATRLEAVLSAPLLKAATKSAQLGSTRDFQTLQDLQQLRNFVTGPVLLTMFDAPVAPLYFLVVYLIHPQLGIIVTVAALILVAVALLNQKLTAVFYSRANAFSQRAAFQAEGMARNAQVVNAMGMVREGTWLWGREMAEALKSQVDAQDRNVIMTGLSKFIRLSTQVALLCWGAYLAIDGQLTGGMMIAASIIASRALAPIEGLIEGWRSYVGARTGYARIMTLINSTPLVTERLLLPRPTGRLHVERVLFVPPPTKRVVLNGIDFKLEPGDSLAIVGPSGTGKSTLAKMLVGSVHPTSGSVRLDMMDIRNWDPRQFGECVGYLPQDVELFPGTIKANIARLRENAPDELIFDAAELAGVTSMIAELPHGYETQIGIDGSPLSGGQRQRLGLARAFYGNPRLVVLDEPNSNLDTAGEQALAQALHRAKERGITVIAVTQRPALLKSVDKIMLMTEGRIQALGGRDDMLPRLAGPRGGQQVARKDAS